MTYHQQYYQKNKDRIIAQQKEYRETYKDLLRKKRIKHYRDNREEILEKEKERRNIRILKELHGNI